MNSRELRKRGFFTIFRNGNVHVVNFIAMTVAVAPVARGRWMDMGMDDFTFVPVDTLPAALRDDITKTVAACYCDRGVDLCDFCGNVRPTPGVER